MIAQAIVAVAVSLGQVTMTSYQPVKGQTDDTPTWTSVGDRTTMFGVAASQDMLRDGRVHYGDVLYIPGFGNRIVNDCMGETKCTAWETVGGKKRCATRVPITNSIDLLVFTHDEEKRVGERRVYVYKLEVKR